jgi:hypothetical protein
VLEPIFGNLGTFFALKEDPLALTDTYRVNGSDRGTWYGLSFSGRLNLKQSMSN